MLKKLIVLLTTVVVLAATHARALGLGDLTLESALNQPLSARIELLQTAGVRMEDIRVQMATAGDFERFSLDRPYYLDSIRFRIHDAGPDNEQPYIELTSTSPIREPYLSFVLDTRWPRGRVLAEYTVLLDPPSFANEGAVQAPQPPVTTRFESPGSSSASAEPDAAPPTPVDAETPADVEEPAPQQVSSSAGQDTSPSAADGAPDAVASDDQSEPAEPAESTEPAEPRRFADTARTVEVGSDDTLWDIALQVRPDDTVSVQQTMLALQRLNPEAFINGNVNLVRSGAVLRVPDAGGVRETGNAEAISEVGRQNRLFEDSRDAPLGSEPLAPPPGQDAGTTSGDGELSVVSVDDSASDETSPASADAAAGEEIQELDDRIAALEDQLAVSREEVDRVERENEELNGRLSMLEEQIESARQIIRLRDMELAQLQESLAADDGQSAQTGGDQDQQDATATPPPPAVTMAPDAPLPQRIIDMVLANPMILGAILALLVALLVLLLIRRNKTKQAELADEQHEQNDEDELDFSGVGTAAAGASDRDESGESDEDGGYRDEEDYTEESPGGERRVSREPYEHHEDDDELIDELRNFSEQDGQPLVDEEVDDLLAEADALIEHEQYEEARKLLEDAIVADPNSQELRVRLLEVLVAQVDLETYRLQESELGTLNSAALQQRVQTLREQVAALESGEGEEAEVDTDMRQDSNDFSDLSEEDDLELELDMESSAEVDDQKVVQGRDDHAGLGDQEDGGAQVDDREEDEDDFGFDLDLDLDDEDRETAEGEPEREERDQPPEPSAWAGSRTEENAIGADDAAEKASSEEEGTGEEEFEFDFDLDLESETDADTKADTETGEEVKSDTTPDDFSADDFNAAQEEETPEEEVFRDRVDDEPEEEADKRESSRDDEDFDFSLDDFALDAETDTGLPGTNEDDEATGDTGAGRDEKDARKDGEADEDEAEEDPFADLSFTDSDMEEEELSGLPGEPDDEFEFLSDTDEAATKLDLARAYIDMGDAEGAREILDEVIKEGTEAQANDARQLIDKLD